MRIIAGRFKGARFPSPPGRGVRPTSDRVREALFSTLGSVVVGSRVLDLFAGSGAFGIEALSREAESVVFVEKDRKVAEALRKTVGSFSVEDSVEILNMDAVRAVGRFEREGQRFGLVFLDPPYGKGLISRLASSGLFSNIIEPDGLVIVERRASSAAESLPSNFEMHFSRRYGSTLVEIFGRL
jgi:16S rRNA (guanine966-N2)-methyltransferase